MTPRKWKLLSKKDVSPHAWFPIEMRSYRKPDGTVISDFSVTTIADVSMVIPVTRDRQAVFVHQFKPGVDEVILEFPAGRIDAKHTDFPSLAGAELEEETGIRVAREQLEEFAVLAGFTTKGTERVHFFLARDCEFNSRQRFDENEDIEVILLPFAEVDKKIITGQIWTAQTIAGWAVAKLKFPDIFRLDGNGRTGVA